MSDYTGAAVIFGATGGVMEAALRTVYAVVNGKELEGIDIKAVRGLENFREAKLDLGGDYGEVKVGIATGLKAARDILDRMKAGEADDYLFIEVMACPGGCISGGGQPRIKGEYQDNKKARQEGLYTIDKSLPIRQSHNNPMIKKIYEEYFGEPNSHKAHRLLHTSYTDRKRKVQHSIKEIWDEIATDNVI